MKYFIIIYLSLLYSLFSYSQRIQKDKITLYYKTNVYSLTTAQKEEITNFLKYYKDTKIHKIVINGSADFVGTNNYNLNLSKKRALKVSDFIKANNFSRIKINALGEQKNPYNYKPAKGIRHHRKTTIICEYILPRSAPKKPPYKQSKKRNYLEQLETLKTNSKIRLKNINFHYGKATLTAPSKPELHNLLRIMKKNKNIVIALEGHVCCGKSKLTEYDLNKYEHLTLSTKRAKKIHDYLLSNGIDSSRISYKGFEFTKPLYYPERTERHRYYNRRVEIKIIRN